MVKLVTPVVPNEPDVRPINVEPETPVVPNETGVCPLIVELGTVTDAPVPVLADEKLVNGVR